RTATGKPMNGPSINHRLHKALAPTRLPNMRIHDLRHTYASLALKEGASLLEVSRALGHSKPTVTLNVYGQSSDAGQRTLASTADRAVGRYQTLARPLSRNPAKPRPRCGHCSSSSSWPRWLRSPTGGVAAPRPTLGRWRSPTPRATWPWPGPITSRVHTTPAV